jgi:fructose-1,6-bisphosphatase/inositol monophosphatase family enzyme
MAANGRPTRAVAVTTGGILPLTVSTDPSSLRPLLDEATELVARCADHVRTRLRGEVAFRRKADGTPVSEVDLEVEAMLRDELTRRHPDDGLLGEEEEAARPSAARRWVIDPIDGTRSLRHGIPLFGILLALEERVPASADGDAWRALVGVMALPALGRVYAAARGLGAWRDGASLRQAAAVPEGPGEEVIALGERRQFVGVGKAAEFDRLLAGHAGARIYPDCFGHALAAEGAVGAMVDYGLRRWDLAATRLIVEEAGGRCLVVGRHGTGDEERLDLVLGKPGVVEAIVAMMAPATG